MAIKEIKDIKVWQKLEKKLNNNTFLHSTGWIDFNKSYDHKYWTLGLFEKKELKSICLVLKIQAKRGKFLFVPHGPLGEINKKTIKTWTTYLKKLAKQESCSFIRISPLLDRNTSNENIFFENGYRNSPIHMHAEHSTVVNLDRPLPDILIGMRKTTRQMIRKGERLIESGDVVIKKHKEINDKLYEVYKETTKRGKFVPFSKKYINQEYKSFNKFKKAHIISVEHNNKVLSWGLFIHNNKRAFYHQGANILHKKIPASYICHWQGMKLAKEKGCISYDFWGVSPKEKTNHPWANISLFKRGFGGDEQILVPAKDYVINWKYWFTFVIEKYRAKKRGF